MSAQRITKRLDLTSLDKGERHRLRSIVLACLLGALMVFLVIVAHAAPVFKSEHDGHPVILRLLDKPCTNAKVLAYIKERVQEQFADKFSAAQLTYGGANWASCWININGVIFSIDEEGAPLQPVRRQYFHEESV